MTVCSLKRGDLVGDQDEMLKRPKWNRDEAEGAAEVEIAHIAGPQRGHLPHCGRLGQQARLALVKHAGRDVDARDLFSQSGDGNEHPSGSAPELEDFSRSVTRLLSVEINVAPRFVDRHVIVKLSYDLDGFVSARRRARRRDRRSFIHG